MSDPRVWVLASSSPRRQRFLEALGFPIVVDPPGLEEEPLPGERTEGFVVRVAREKLAKVAPRHPGAWVIAADTVVLFEDTILGKPADEGAAVQMLRRLSGRWHRVLTAVALAGGGKQATRVVESLVKFRPLSPHEIHYYVATGEPMDKAGAYGLQGLGTLLVERIHGSCSNVAGFPVEAFLALVEELAGPPWTRFAASPRMSPLWP